MHNDLQPRLNRSLDPRSSERIIADRNQFPFSRDLRDRLKIDQLEQRIAGRLDPNQPRVWFDCALEVFLASVNPRTQKSRFAERLRTGSNNRNVPPYKSSLATICEPLSSNSSTVAIADKPDAEAANPREPLSKLAMHFSYASRVGLIERA